MTNTTYQVIGCRIPRDFFIAQGRGESDVTIHAGSYHKALAAAGVEFFNHMTYSSVLPGVAKEVSRPERYTHGAVMEGIAAVAHSEHGQRATAGIIYGWLLDRKTEKKYGGLVCEYNGSNPASEAEEILKDSLQELYVDTLVERYKLATPRIITESFVPEKKYGTALVLMGFVNYVVPVLDEKKK